MCIRDRYGAENVYDFSLGNPNVPAPAEVKKAVFEDVYKRQFNGCIPWGKTVKAWILCYVGNILGSLLGVAGFQLTGVPKGDIGAYFAQVAAAKMSLRCV